MRLLSVFPIKSSGGRKPKIYNLDMILSVGYRVNLQNEASHIVDAHNAFRPI